MSGAPADSTDLFESVGEALFICGFCAGVVLAAFGLYDALWYNLVQGIFSLLGLLKGSTVMLADQGLIALFLVCFSLVAMMAAGCFTVYRLRRLDIEEKRRERLDALDREIALAAAGLKTVTADGDTIQKLVDGLHEKNVRKDKYYS